MFARTSLSLLFASLIAVPALCQVEPSATGGAAGTQDDTDMMTPPPVSGMPYPGEAGADTRSNYLSAAINVNAAYNDNVLPGANARPISDESYWILPALSLNKSSGRQDIMLGYSPSFSFYQQTSSLDTVDQSASLVYKDRLSPHLSLSVQDYFLRTSNVFNESYPFSSGNLTGSTEAPVPGLIVPYVEQMSDTANGSIDYQFGRDSMIGGGASYTTFSFPNPTAAAGLSNSDGEGGSAFYSRRISDKQYAGLSYDYSRDVVTDDPYPPFTTQLHTLLPFYSTFFTPKFSLSISAGIQHISISQLTVTQGYGQWSVVGTASVGWQGTRGSFALSYLHSINSGEGFGEDLTSDSVSASSGWKINPTWSSSFEVSYVNSSPVTTRVGMLNYGYEGGNAFTLGANLTHTIGERFSAACGYDRLQENYPGIPFIANNPDSDRVFVTVTYLLRKSIGR
jgi:hypothetical protein